MDELFRNEVYCYKVVVQFATIGKKFSQIIKLLLQLPEYCDFQEDVVIEFKSILVSRRRLVPNAVGSVIQFRAEGEDEPRAHAQTYRLRVEETGTLAVSELTDYLTSTSVNTAYADKLPVLQALNVFLGHYAESSPAIATVGPSKKLLSLSSLSEVDLEPGCPLFEDSSRVFKSRLTESWAFEYLPDSIL